MADEPLRDVQLNGKPLVFLFMSATVVAVVIFLAGVMVGRGVRSPASDAAAAATEEAIDPTAPVTATASTTSDGASAATQETLTYPSRLEGETPPDETLFDVPEEQVDTPAPAPAPAAKAPSPAPAARPAAAAAVAESAAKTAAAEPPGNGFVVQVAATSQRSEADTIANRLVAKGYPAFVTTPASGPRMFRVRVGKYEDRLEADRVAGRLQREEHFKPWITR
jgi:cell division septation protein DedD